MWMRWRRPLNIRLEITEDILDFVWITFGVGQDLSTDISIESDLDMK